ncbi:AI-2E family transporter [Brevibacillus sp. MER 51]|uniref:AI-2E family transporter n=1 Tax=Brevibacillus sp. MER 51 TaxID=2939560 RepID=UPI00203BBB83|nr:AI-2E family transporter [Brevibacillus sp. MER 51]MCM3144895.1 AI-2E family transporter [Brevibacillus sp. MER 51]
MNFFAAALQKPDVRRFGILALFCLLLYSLGSMLNMVLLTFLVTYLMNRLHQYLTRLTHKVAPIHPKLILIFLYMLLTFFLVVGGMKAIPALIHQTGQLFHSIEQVYHQNQDNEFAPYLMSIVGKLDMKGIVQGSLDFLAVVRNVGFNVFLAIILSLFFLLGKNNVVTFTAQFRTSKLSWLYNEIAYFSQKFILTFGKVIETQLLIALFNTTFTVIGLWIMGFPNLLGLAIMVFILGLIPVAGVAISLIPLSAIAFSVGGLATVIYLLIFIMVIHALEAYVLNPRLMATKTHLPIFYTFVVLIFSEHFFGVWGLIVGIPSFVFLLDILEVKKMEQPPTKNKTVPKDVRDVPVNT